MIFIQIAAELPTEAAPTAVLLLSEPLPVANPMHPLSLVDLSRDQTTFHGHTTSSELLTPLRRASALALATPLLIGAGARAPSLPKSLLSAK
jgi:hypothetical protein